MLSPLLHPKSIAVVGVSLDPTKVGHQIFVNLHAFKGDVFAVNPKHKRILGHPSFESILSIPGHIDLVVIATPAPTVESIVDECIDKHVKAIVIISAGFAETGSAGQHTQERIQEKLASHHILLLGPNTLGVINPREQLNASFAPSMVSDGHIALISQSGAMLTTIFAEFESRGVGCSFALSLGNKAGVSELEALEYAAHDEHTKSIALYLESIANAREFLTLCKKISKTKPIVFLKGGTTDTGMQASVSHTAALATNNVLLKEASYQMGYVLVETLEQFFETSFFVDSVLTHQGKLPENLMILTNAGGPAVNAVDVAATSQISLATWSKKSMGKFAREIPRVLPANPTDLLGDASVRDIELGLEFATEDNGIESILLIITPQAVTDIPGITRMLIEMKPHKKKPFVVALMGGEKQHASLVKLREHGITAVEYANEGVEIFASLRKLMLATHIDRSQELMKRLEVALAGQEPTTIRSRQTFPLQKGTLEETYILLENYGFTLPTCAIARSILDVEKMRELDPERVFPLIAKTANLQLKHKALVGGIVKNIRSVQDAVDAYVHLERFSPEVLFQEVITDATEVILGGKRDPQFGPFLAIGMGGSLTNILADRAYIFLPASGRELRLALRRTKLYSALTNDQRSLCLLSLEKFSRIFHDHPEIEEMEINPLMVKNDVAYVADVKVTLAASNFSLNDNPKNPVLQ